MRPVEAKASSPAPPAAEAQAPATAPEPSGAVEFIPVPHSIARTLREAWAGRHSWAGMSMRMISKQYAKTKLGRSWLVIRPFMDALGFALVFGGVLGVSSREGTPYLLFLVVGTSIFRLWERVIFWGTRSFDRFQKWTRRFDMPLLLIPLAGLTPALIEFLVYMSIVTLAAFVYLAIDGKFWIELGPELLYAAAGLVLIMMMALGVLLFTSIWNAYTRDVRNSIRYVFQIALFVTPVLYPLSQLPDGVEQVAAYNPLAAPVLLFRKGLLGSSAPIEMGPLLVSIGFSCLLLFAALFYFSRAANNFMGPAGWERGSRRGDDDDDDEDDDVVF